MTGDVIRQRFLDFFAAQDHLVLASAKLLPDDPTTYFTTAGMQPFVPYFLGNEAPPSRRIATCQKCLRADDLDEVGYTARHLTYFEMLGNFSFGDYFKKEAIAWGWEFVRQGLELDPELLWVSVYENDDEAAEIWANHVGVRRERIVRFGMADNWWGPVGNCGPCGPCSEIFLDRGPAWGGAASPVEDDGDRYVELWNLVFQQYNSTMSKKELMACRQVPDPLPAPGIDTGAGLERIAAAMQGVSTVFESDLLRPVCEAVLAHAAAHGTTVAYGADREQTAAVNRIADHARALTFAICDGMFPSNKAGGYVLRQVLRRAARFGRLRLGLREPFVWQIAAAVADRYEAAYPEVRAGLAAAQALIRQEEERFGETLNYGIPKLEAELHDLQDRGATQLSGDRAFMVYETYGVPIEVQVDVAAERGLSVDLEGFEAARTNRESVAIAKDFEGHGDFGDDLLAAQPKTVFLGYEVDTAPAEVLALVVGGSLDAARNIVSAGQLVELASDGQEVLLVLDRSPFYAESGGQVGDQGVITAAGGSLTVSDTRKDKNGRWLHHGRIVGSLPVGASVTATVDTSRRNRIKRAHTATHLLHAALRGRLGQHVAQAGSQVDEDWLRFDFSHFSALGAADLQAVEEHVNELILGNHAMRIGEHSLDEARGLGALMFFGEKYGQVVRVVNVGEQYGALSTELCGGTHVQRTGDIGHLRLVAEGSVGSGVRRVEALTGQRAVQYAREQEARLREAASQLRAPVGEVVERIAALNAQVRELEREAEALRAQSVANQVSGLVGKTVDVAGLPVLAQVSELDVDGVKALADDLCARLPAGVALLGTAAGGKVMLVCKAGEAAVARGVHCGEVVKAAAQAAGGGGGGKPSFAQAGGRDASKLGEAIEAGLAKLRTQVG
ncbi:MAG: alanine--tRNA ligase [Fimbriimonadaceae bacterium]|nr:alanine--tRNA ligase [Fimbriimonadaceae bacterium]